MQTAMNDKVENRWNRIKRKRNVCQNCASYYSVTLVRNSSSRIKRYRIECKRCNCCGKDAMTIIGALLKWNMQKTYDEDRP